MLVKALIVLAFVLLAFAVAAGLLWYGNRAGEAFDDLEDEPWH